MKKEKFCPCGGEVSNKFHGLCPFCNLRRLNKDKPKKTYAKKPRKPTGEKIVFKEIWEEREHICVNCKDHLGSEAIAHFFSHIIPKSIRPDLRLKKSNIELLCMICHHVKEFESKAAFEARKNMYGQSN